MFKIEVWGESGGWEVNHVTFVKILIRKVHFISCAASDVYMIASTVSSKILQTMASMDGFQFEVSALSLTPN